MKKHIDQQNQYNFSQELKTVLTHTNAVPFKVKGCKYYCAYCFINRDCYEDPDDLRLHVRSHKLERVKNLDRMLRPHFMNEILRLDIEALRCVSCNIPISCWDDMLSHIETQHQLTIEQCRKRLIPYKLKRDSLLCALCDQKCPNFNHLDAHMNGHYCNYVCSECGEPFLSENRLKHHVQIHSTGRFPCEECGKAFTLAKYLKKHISMVHKRSKSFKCMHCPERFHSDIERHGHVLESHEDKVRISTCELCGKSFNWKPYYLAHLRKVHSAEKKNKCRYCNKGFVAKHELKMHEQRHTGTGRHYCNICGKNFVTMMELRGHIKRHAKEMCAVGSV